MLWGSIFGPTSRVSARLRLERFGAPWTAKTFFI